MNRHDRGVKTAGVAMGGKFAATERTPAEGFLLSSPAPEHWDGTAQAAQDILNKAGLQGVEVDGVGDHTVIFVGGCEADAGDVLEPGNGLSEEVRDEAIRERASNLLDRDRLANLQVIKGSFTPELAAMKQQEIDELVARIDEFDSQSRWADGNELAIKNRHTVTEEQVGQTGSYEETVAWARDEQNASWNQFLYQQTLKAGLPIFSDDTFKHYHHEIGDFLADRYGAEVTLDLVARTFTAERESTVQGAATTDRIEEIRNTTATATYMHAAGTRDDFGDEELLEYLQSHEKIGAAEIAATRDDWSDVNDIGARVHDLGDRMRPADWAVALQAVAPSLGNGGNAKAIKQFINQGKIGENYKFASQLRGYTLEGDGATDEFRDVANQLAERLMDRPLIDRPTPDWA